MHQNGYIGRKMRLPKLKKKPAIVIAAFGTTNRAKTVLNIFQKALEKNYPDESFYWAYTSEIVRKRLNLPSIQQILAQIEADGYRKVVVQPLHIFPGTEYQQLAETCNFFPGLRVFMGETLLHRWNFVREILKAIEPELLPPEEGCNLMALHGTPLAADPVNIVYMGLDLMLEKLYPNVLSATVEGIPNFQALFASIKRDDYASKYKKIKIIPMMYFAGLHTEEDLMGKEDSWRTALEALGFKIECPTITYNGKESYKGLGHYPEVTEGFLNRLKRTLELSEHY